MSDKAKLEYQVWIAVKRERAALLNEKFGYIPCEFCKIAVNHGAIPDGHHNDHNRRHNILSNCRLLHRTCHTHIHDQNIKDVPSLL